MLIIARREQETITIETPAGDTITITLAEIRGRKQVAIGIEAPAEHKINRGPSPCDHARKALKYMGATNPPTPVWVCVDCGTHGSGGEEPALGWSDLPEQDHKEAGGNS